MPRSSEEDSAINPKCFVHLKSVSPAEKAQFVTNVRWSKIVECSKKWINLFGNKKELALCRELVSLDLLELSYEEARDKQPDIGFHATCYRRYIDSKRLTAAEKHCKEVTPFEITS